MVRTYTPEERAERRRKSSERRANSNSNAQAFVDLQSTLDVGDDESAEASWIADLRAQGVDVDEFLTAALPEVMGITISTNTNDAQEEDVNDELSIDGIDVSERSDRSGNEGRHSSSSNNKAPSRNLESRRASTRSIVSIVSTGSLQLSRKQRLSIISRFSNQPDVDEKAKKIFSDAMDKMDKSYNYDETSGKDIVKRALEKMTPQQWQREVERDAINYDPSSTNDEKIQQNREWALKMARKRCCAAAGYNKPQDDNTEVEGDVLNNSSSPQPKPTKIDPPEITPLPPLSEEDFNNIPLQALNPRELGIFPPTLPHQLIDIVPKLKPNTGIGDGIVIHGTFEERLESIDSDTMVVTCRNQKCNAFLYTPRNVGLVRCDNCWKVSPACPETIKPPRLAKQDHNEGIRRSLGLDDDDDDDDFAMSELSVLGDCVEDPGRKSTFASEQQRSQRSINHKDSGSQRSLNRKNSGGTDKSGTTEEKDRYTRLLERKLAEG
jgi:hypothetical protein